MSGIGSQTGSFQAPHIPQKSARQAAKQGTAIAKTTKTVTKPSAPEAKPSQAETLPEKQIETQEKRHTQTVRDLRNSVAKSRQRTDSFQKRLHAGASPAKSKAMGDFAGKIQKDKELKQKATEFAQRINSQQLQDASSKKPIVDKPELQQNHQIAAQAVQGNDYSPTNKKKSNKKAANTLDAKLEKIFSLGGERGKKFVAFIRREQAAGPLSESIKDLVNDFYETIKGDSLSASELALAAEENLSLVKSMVSSDNVSELIAIQDALSNSVVNSAGERADLLALRNTEKNQARIAPPDPQQAIKQTASEIAIEFVSSIDFGVIKAPWDPPLLQA